MPKYINKRDKVPKTSKWCSLSRSPNTYVNTIKKTFRAVSSGAKFHLLVQNVVFTQFQVAGRCTFQWSLLCWSLQRLFTSVSDSHLPDLCANIIWRNRSLHLIGNCTILQVVEIILVDALHNHHWAFGHLEITISYRYHKAQCFQSANWDKISFELRYIPHFLQFLYHPIKYLDTDCTYPFHIIRMIITRDNENPSSFSKLKN